MEKIRLQDLKFRHRIEKNIFISPLCIEDALSIHQQIGQNYDYLLPWCPWIKDLKNLSDIYSFLNDYFQQLRYNQYLRFGIYHHNRVCGWVAAFDFDWKKKKYYLGYWIAWKYRKRGYVNYTVRFTIFLLSKIFNLNDIYICCIKNNFPSRSLICNLGAKNIFFDSTNKILTYKISKCFCSAIYAYFYLYQTLS